MLTGKKSRCWSVQKSNQNRKKKKKKKQTEEQENSPKEGAIAPTAPRTGDSKREKAGGPNSGSK